MWKKIVKFLKWAAAYESIDTNKKKEEKVENVSAVIKRARTSKGTYKGDDKSTPDINEAWEGGKAPKKSGRSTKHKK
tara:strand:+ start:128 stop:358 length:231 start_codon:yes stop_codon:yes gene_type:complete